VTVVVHVHWCLWNVCVQVYELTATIEATISAPSSLATGTPVSLTTTGSVLAGGGTSIYLSIASLLQSSPSDLTISPIFTSPVPTYLVSTTKHEGTTYTNMTTFTVVTVAAASSKQTYDATIKSTATMPFGVFSITALNPNSGLFVTISEDESMAYNESVVRIGSVDTTTYALTFGPAVTYDTNTQYSITPLVSPISDTQFAIAYYKRKSVLTRIGTILAGSGAYEIILSNSVLFADNSDFDVMFDVVGLTNEYYLAIHYPAAATTDTTPINYLGYLQATIVFVNSSTYPYVNNSPSNASITLGPTFTSTSTQATGFVYGAKMNSNTAIVAFGDYTTGGGITVQAVTVSNELTVNTQQTQVANYSVIFGSTLSITVGQSEALTTNGFMDLDIVTISNDGQFLVLFSDLSNFGSMTTAAGKV
jgi:hypothetical protein